MPGGLTGLTSLRTKLRQQLSTTDPHRKNSLLQTPWGSSSLPHTKKRAPAAERPAERAASSAWAAPLPPLTPSCACRRSPLPAWPPPGSAALPPAALRPPSGRPPSAEPPPPACTGVCMEGLGALPPGFPQRSAWPSVPAAPQSLSHMAEGRARAWGSEVMPRTCLHPRWLCGPVNTASREIEFCIAETDLLLLRCAALCCAVGPPAASWPPPPPTPSAPPPSAGRRSTARAGG